MPYTTVRFPARAELTEKRSRFIGCVYPCASEEEALARVADARREHRDARHHVYAYVLCGGRRRYSDDGEPQGSAGQPVLEAITREGLCDVCAVVTRYFGGILLGTGGLARAYAGAAKGALDAAGRKTLRACAALEVSADYALYGAVSRLLTRFRAEITEQDFSASVRLRFVLPAAEREPFEKQLRDISAGALIPGFLGETLAEIPGPGRNQQ